LWNVNIIQWRLILVHVRFIASERGSASFHRKLMLYVTASLSGYYNHAYYQYLSNTLLTISLKDATLRMNNALWSLRVCWMDYDVKSSPWCDMGRATSKGNEAKSKMKQPLDKLTPRFENLWSNTLPLDYGSAH